MTDPLDPHRREDDWNGCEYELVIKLRLIRRVKVDGWTREKTAKVERVKSTHDKLMLYEN